MSVKLGENKITDIVKMETGTGGTGDYNELTNKPQINGVTLTGNLTTEDLKINVGTIDAYTKSETNDLIGAAVSSKADTIYVNEQLNLKADKSALNASLETKADKTNVYTKEETIAAIGSAITDKADTSYVNDQLTLKADKSNTYTKTEVDNAISNTNTVINNKLDTKANKSDVYTKNETIQAIKDNTANKADTTYVNEQLNLKADKSDTYTKEEVDDMFERPTITGDTYPIGAIAPYAGTTTPQNWLLCDGREVSRETYSQLFAVIGTTWGAGDGSTSFNLPDLRDKFPVGAGGDIDLAETGGEKEVKLTNEQIPSHQHTVGSSPENPSGSYKVLLNGKGYSNDLQVATSFTGGGKAHNNMPPYAGSYYIIKAKQSSGVIATVVDTLESSSTTDALSAKQGKSLNNKINNLAISIGSDPETVDNDWKQLEVSDNFELYNEDEPIKYRKIGNIVEVVGVLKPKKELEASSNTVVMCTLPIEYRPSIQRFYICQGSNNNKWLLTVYSNGNLGISRYGVSSNINIPTTAWLPFNIIFMID